MMNEENDRQGKLFGEKTRAMNVEATASLLLKRAMRRMHMELKGSYSLEDLVCMAVKVQAPVAEETDDWVIKTQDRYGIPDEARRIMLDGAKKALELVRAVGG